ncbi:peptidylprolyl isomerase [Synoicihabitans lomoniglobus]|uniref:peptidylprolyl isomerase n=1 Tax=Synoicihabitans lomoniglobus TaxID=2909285 RepID=A0AAF0CRZ9_9BACT|nr:peptidylprolyl isomerase [Opitutaceae bacterium LMO-M01]WED66934.1 peptidylprolyl isomerase [Opitutaceae bacterium LMO-M01]
MTHSLAAHIRVRMFALAGVLALGSPLFAQTSSTKTDDGLNLRFANGIAAVAEAKIITVDDIRREIAPMVPEIQRTSRNEQEFNRRLEALQDDTIQALVDRVLIVKDFYSDEKRRIPASYVDNAVDENIINEFEGDRSKFLAYLRARGLTLREYRREVEEDIIYQYMRGQKRKSATVVSPVQVQTFYDENKEEFYQEDSVHLRLIQFTRKDGRTDSDLLTLAARVQARLDVGHSFEDIAKEVSEDSRRSRGGDWGWLNRSGLKKEFSDPVFELSAGQATNPILLPEGVYILFAEDRKFAGIMPINDVREQIERALISREARSAQEQWLERLRRNSYVKLY